MIRIHNCIKTNHWFAWMLDNLGDAAAAANVVEEQWEQLLRTNCAAQWPVTAMQLTAPQYCREATRYIGCLLYLQHPCCWLKEAPLSRPEAVCGTAGTFGAKPPASRFSIWGINHLWQPCEHTDGPSWWRFLFHSGLAAAQSMVSDCGKQILA